VYQGAHWTLLGYGLERSVLQPRPGLHIHTFGLQGDLHDDRGHFLEAYGPAVGEWVLVRPDGYVAAIVSNNDVQALEDYLVRVGMGASDNCDG
jgi:hypothetical protein